MSEGPNKRKDPAFWENRYVEGDMPWDTGKPDVHLVRAMEQHKVPAGSALDVGCGTGTNVLWLAAQGFEAVGVDLSQTAIDRAKASATKAGASCEFRVANLLTDDIAGAPFTLAFDRGCFHLFEDAEDRASFAARLAAHLGEGGLWMSLLGSTDGPDRETGPPRRSATEILTAIEPHFELLDLRHVSFDEDALEHIHGWFMVARRRESLPTSV